MRRVSHRGFIAAAGAILVAGLVVSAALPAYAATPTAKASPSKNLTNGETVKVSGKGWPASDSLVIVECDAAAGQSGAAEADCNVSGVVAVSANKKGVVAPTPFTFATGAIGSGTCNAGQTCYLVLTEASATGLHALMKVTVKK